MLACFFFFVMQTETRGRKKNPLEACDCVNTVLELGLIPFTEKEGEAAEEATAIDKVKRLQSAGKHLLWHSWAPPAGGCDAPLKAASASR